MRLVPVLVGFAVGALVCGCAGLFAGVLVSSGDLADMMDGAYLSSYDQGHAFGGMLAGPCCVGCAGGVFGALIGAVFGRRKL